MDASARQSRDVATLRPEEQQATCSEFVTAQIELSKRHWSELSKPIGDDISSKEAAEAKLDNQEAWKIWESHLEWDMVFFKTFGYSFGTWPSAGSLEVGEKFAEGAQAELFHARVKWSYPKMNAWDLRNGRQWVLKVFKEGTLVRDLQRQWPEGLFCCRGKGWDCVKLGSSKVWELKEHVLSKQTKYICNVHCATLLEDGRFAFLMEKEDGDLRSLIERKMVDSDHGRGPFSKEVGDDIMYRVAKGMDTLHSYDIVHRDLKASNVLVKTFGKHLWCFVADFESSMKVVGTGFWRAPKILQACRDRNVGKRQELFTMEADSYSYGMMCYEVLTGKVPFQEHPLSDKPFLLRDLVIDQHLRPEVPDYVEDWAKELLQWCWKSDCDDRPSFKEILGFLEANSKFIKQEDSVRLMMEDFNKEVSKRLAASCINAKE